MSRAKVSEANKSSASPQMTIAPDRRYWRESESPLASLLFLLPMIVLYECGTGWLAPGHEAGQAAGHRVSPYPAVFYAICMPMPSICRRLPWRLCCWAGTLPLKTRGE